MAMKFKKGDVVRQVVRPIEGAITDATIADVEVIFKVEWTDDKGDHRARYFKEDEIEVVPAAPVSP